MNNKTKIALVIGIPIGAVIFLLPTIVGEINPSRIETQSTYNPDVCSGLYSEREQRSAEYDQKTAEYDQKTAEHASALFEYNKELLPSPSYTSQIQQMSKELQQMYKELTYLETRVRTLTDQYNSHCVT
jgi:hypothetical protein